MTKKFPYLQWIVIAALSCAVVYGVGRLYFYMTDGFLLDNILSNLVHDARWETRSLSSQEREQVCTILSQPFVYLGKGCQSYVFLSADDSYILKFFKYQRLRNSGWLESLASIPWMKNYIDSKAEKKRKKRETFFNSWRLAFDELQPETGLLYIHLNKTDDFHQILTIQDKIGSTHYLDVAQMEFLLQKKAQMLCPYIEALLAQNQIAKITQLLDHILSMILSEYERGYADNDHALMQNTGVLNGLPIHIDVGQFMVEDRLQDPNFLKQELFTKMYRFEIWLRERSPELADYLQIKLRGIIGPAFDQMQPHFCPQCPSSAQ